MISDRQFQFSLTTALAWVFWASTLACMALAYVFNDWLLAALGCASTGAAATLHIRSFLCAITAREREAFLLGQEVGRDRPRSIR